MMLYCNASYQEYEIGIHGKKAAQNEKSSILWSQWDLSFSDLVNHMLLLISMASQITGYSTDC